VKRNEILFMLAVVLTMLITGKPASAQSSGHRIYFPVIVRPGPGSVHAIVYSDGVPVAGYVFLLGTVIMDDSFFFTVSFDPAFAPKAVSDENGDITFTNVPYDYYGLVLRNGPGFYLLVNPYTGKAISVSIIPASLADLGKLEFFDLPLHSGSKIVPSLGYPIQIKLNMEK
jgi:hypothetical protein